MTSLQWLARGIGLISAMLSDDGLRKGEGGGWLAQRKSQIILKKIKEV
jgi:hypothetical protein